MAKILNPWGDGRHADVRADDCCARPCLHVGENKGTFAQGRGYTSYYKDPTLECMTRHIHGCPHPLPDLDPEAVRCCRVPDFPLPRKGLKPYQQRCRTCGTWAKGIMLEMRRTLPQLEHVDCDHRGVHERDERDFLGYMLWTCPKCRLNWKAKPNPKDPGKTYGQLLDEKFPSPMSAP